MKRLVLGSIILVGGVMSLLSFQANLTPYVGFSQAMEAGRMVQVLGDLVPGQEQITETGDFRFSIIDEAGQILPIIYSGGRPTNMDHADAIGAIGVYKDGAFMAQRLLLKCPSKYQEE